MRAACHLGSTILGEGGAMSSLHLGKVAPCHLRSATGDAVWKMTAERKLGEPGRVRALRPRDAREIVGQHVQCHLGSNFRQALHEKMRRAHPR